MSGLGARPPRWAEWILSTLTPWQYRDEQLGDLHEGFVRRLDAPRDARRWYVRQVLRSLPAALRLRYQALTDDRRTPEPKMETIGQDLRYGLRSLWKSPGFAIVSTITLALAIGVNTSIFSIVNAIVFADLPMRDSETVALVRGVNPELEIAQGSVSPADYLELVERSRSFESLEALTESDYVMTGGDQPMRVNGLQVTAGTSQTWRLPPVLGRGFAEGEDRYGAAPVAMLSHGFWQEHFSGRTDVLGETIRLDGVEHTIIGVTNPKLEFASFRIVQVITPLILNRSAPNRMARYLFVSGRLAPGVTQQMATEEVRAIGEALAREYPAQNQGWGLWSAPVMESLIDENGNTILLFLQLTVGMVILIACANVANMLLARATSRAREIAVRAALGAGRPRILRQLLTESMVISLSAAALGIGLAYALNRALIWISAGTEEVFQMAKLDGRVMAFTLLVSLAAPLLFGLFPALRASAVGASAVLRDGRSGDGGRAGKRARGALVTAQVSMALTLMIVAGLLTRTVVNLQTRPLGFDPAGLLTVEVDLPEARYDQPDARIRFFEQAREALAEVPGLGEAELTNTIAGVGFGAGRSMVIEGVELPEGRAAPTALITTLSPGYFDLIGLPLLDGRAFAEADGPDAPKVAIVSRAIANRFWPNADPVGRRVQVAGSEEWMEVVGIVADVRGSSDIEGGSPNIYVPYAQDARELMYLVARHTATPAALAGPIRDAIWSVDPDQPVDAIQTIERAQYEAGASNLALLSLFVIFAIFALLMAAIGIYGVMAYAVSQRRSEIGLRMALGAERGSVRWMVVRQGAGLMALGIAIGLGASFLLSRMLANLVFGISPTDPLTFIGVPAILASVALIANLIPARRATRLDPANTLRSD